VFLDEHHLTERKNVYETAPLQYTCVVNWRMASEETSSTNDSRSISSWQIGFLFSFLAIFAPAYAIIYWSVGHTTFVHLYGMLLWFWCDISSGEWWLVSGPFAFGQTMLFTLLRPLFAVQMVRFYRNKSSKRLTFLIGLITELQPIIVNFQTVLWLTESNLILRLPIPITFLVAITMMRLIQPQHKPELWLEKDEEKNQSWRYSEKNLKLTKIDIIYKILETALVSEIVLYIYGGFTIAYWFPAPLVIFYWFVLPWSILITGVLFLIIRHIRNRKALWALYGPD